MEVNVKKAIKTFFSKSSFEMIYFEAFANALDADASVFNIKIVLPKPSQWKDMILEISDNGVGFDDIRFSKFKTLLDVDEQSHKGLGRLVYLCYFDTVKIESIFNDCKQRDFEFSENFKGENKIVSPNLPEGISTRLYMEGFNGERLGKADYANPKYIKNTILSHFYMKFYKAKLNKKRIVVKIQLDQAGNTYTETIDSNDIPKFSVYDIPNQLDLFNNISLYYYINKLENPCSKNVITAIAVDDRSHQIDIIAEENLPVGYEMIFLLISETFRGEVDESRMNLTIPESTLNVIKVLFRNGIATIINSQFPEIASKNSEKKIYLENTYPHLSGYFEAKEIGYASQGEILKRAQDKYFKDQKEILSSKNLTDEQFEKSVNLSARALAEYIIFRQNVINKMKSVTPKNLEADLHNIIAPKGSEFQEGEKIKDLYRNNVWVLDDKFMSYCTVLSEAEMTKVVSYLTEGEPVMADNDRPDITLFFSSNPDSDERKVDVVVVELKRLGLKAELNSIVEFQLYTRAIRLAEYYGSKIQRMWFYGIVEFNDEYETHLINSGFEPLYSTGNVYFRSKTIYTDKTKSKSVIQNVYIMDYKALVEDANSRNETFLKILQNKFKSE